ncbi:MAG: hypothetical protein IKQ75_03275 [Bacteroidales bacterium]|nr:hypothetical protein [Bacteroidales bacterium]MBR6160870.1 hypothetical protein [Bacteroidales bacterium]
MQTPTTIQPQDLSWAEIKNIVLAVSDQIKETGQQIKADREQAAIRSSEIDRQIKESREQAAIRSAEIDRQIKEDRERLLESKLEWDAALKRMEETDAIAKQCLNETKYLRNLFQTEWGRLIESLCTPAALKLFSDLDIGISHIYTEGRKAKDNGIDRMEADIILCNGSVAVVGEVKTTCTVKHVDRFLEKMKQFKTMYPEFSSKTVYAAVAAIKYNQSSDAYARNAGLFVIRTTGDGVFSMDQPKERLTY